MSTFNARTFGSDFAKAKSGVREIVLGMAQAYPKAEVKADLPEQVVEQISIGFLDHLKSRRGEYLEGDYIIVGGEAKRATADEYKSHKGEKLANATIDMAMAYSTAEVTHMKDHVRKAVVQKIRKAVKTNDSDRWKDLQSEWNKVLDKPAPQGKPPAELSTWLGDIVKKVSARIKTAEARGDKLKPEQLEKLKQGLALITQATK